MFYCYYVVTLIVIKLSHHTMLDVSIYCVKFQIWMYKVFLRCRRMNSFLPDLQRIFLLLTPSPDHMICDVIAVWHTGYRQKVYAFSVNFRLNTCRPMYLETLLMNLSTLSLLLIVSHVHNILQYQYSMPCHSSLFRRYYTPDIIWQWSKLSNLLKLCHRRSCHTYHFITHMTRQWRYHI